MSTHISPGTLIVETDPIKLNARLNDARAEQLAMMKKGWIPDPRFSEEENSTAQVEWEAKLQALIREQMGIIFVLRKTSTGPAKAGGKRAKKAPIDLSAVDDAIFGPST